MKDWRERISIDPKVCHGEPCIKGTRIMLWIVVDCLANGDSGEKIHAAFVDAKNAIIATERL